MGRALEVLVMVVKQGKNKKKLCFYVENTQMMDFNGITMKTKKR